MSVWPRYARRLWRETDHRCLWRFIRDFGLRGARGIARWQRRRRAGALVPPYLFISITDRCNLRCQGCWVTPANPTREIGLDTLDTLIASARQAGTDVFGILGGEPLLCQGLIERLAAHRGAYFILFTNGTLLDDALAGAMRRAGNITPLISIEGLAQVSDERRGGRDVYARTLRGLAAARRAGLVTGVATSLCASNVNDLATDAFIEQVIAQGAHYLWYYLYRPVGPDPAPDLCLDAGQIRAVRRFLVEARARHPLVLVDAYWDQDGRALCPAVAGLAYHIGPGGAIEPCPPIQFARETIGDGRDAMATIRDSTFLRDFRTFAAGRTRGCVLLEQPAALRAFLEQQGAQPTSGRDGFAELARATGHPGHALAGEPIPETEPFYRWAKRHAFFGMGAYG